MDGAKGVKRGRVDGDDRGGGGEGSALNSGDAEIDTLVMQLGTEGEDRSKRKSKKKVCVGAGWSDVFITCNVRCG